MPLPLTGTFTANGASQPFTMMGDGTNSGRQFDLSIAGLSTTGASVQVQRSFDAGGTWKNVGIPYTADVEDVGFEPRSNVLYRLSCSNYSTGTILYGLG